LVEGTTVSTRYGMVKTDHILFIASGRLPSRQALGPDPRAAGALSDPRRARTALDRRLRAHPGVHDASQVKQYQALLGTEGVTLEFRPGAIRRIAEIAFQVNESTENIGARRLYTVLEKLLEEISFDAGKRGPGTIAIDAAYVDARLAELSKNEDLARFVL
jgi:ATP-dependent HslUV protease ATP-binding subunit HslU